MSEEQNRFSLRKLSVGLASVLIGVSIFGTSQTVKADTVANNQTSSVTSNAQSSDTQKNENAVKSSFSNDNQVDNAKSNLIQTQGNNLQQVQSNNVQQNPTSSQEANSSNDLQQKDAEKDIVRTSSLQKTNNQSNPIAEKAVQNTTPTSDQTVQSFNLQKNSKPLDSKKLATNLTQDSNNDWGTDPSKYGFHKTNAGWTTLQQGNDYTSVAKISHTTLLNPTTEKELSHDDSIEVSEPQNVGIDITATIDKKDIKKGNKILISSTTQLYKDGRHFTTDLDGSVNSIQITTNGVDIGHIDHWSNDTYNTNGGPSQFAYFLVVDQTLDLTKDLTIHIKNPRYAGLNQYSAQYNSEKGTTADNPAYIKWIANDSDTYNYKLYVDPSKKTQPHHQSDSNGLPLVLGQNLYNGDIWLGTINRNPEKSFTSQNYNLNKVIKISRPRSIQGVTIPNFDSTDFKPNLAISEYYPLLDKDGMYNNAYLGDLNIPVTRIANGLSAQQVEEAAKTKHLVYSISDDGQSVLVGLNFLTNNDSITKLAGYNYSTDQIINAENSAIKNSRLGTIDYPDKINEIIDYSTNWLKIHNNTPSSIAFNLNYLPYNISKPNIQTASDVTPGIQNPASNTVSVIPSGIDVDTSVYHNINVKFVDDDNNEKVINTDTFTTSTGTDLTYNIKSSSDKTFNSTTDIAFPSNYVLNQANSVHYGVIQDTNPDIVIHVKHLVKVVSGDTDLDLYPNIKKALNSDARRTITFHYPANSQGKNPSQIVQSVHFIRSGKADFTTDTVDTSTLTQWNVVVSTAQGVIIKDGKAHFAPLTIKDLPHINGYKAHVVRSKVNPAVYMVSFMAVPSEVKPSLPNEEKPSTPTKQPETPVTPEIPDNPNWDKLDHKVVDVLNQSDSGWTMPENNSTYTVEVPEDAIIDLSDLVIAEPVHAQTRTQIRVTKRFKLSKKHSIKHLKHRKKAVRTFRKYRL